MLATPVSVKRNNNNNNNNTKMKFKGPKDDEFHPDEQIILLYATTAGYAVPDDEQNGGNLIRSVFNTLGNNVISNYHLNDLFTIFQKKSNDYRMDFNVLNKEI